MPFDISLIISLYMTVFLITDDVLITGILPAFYGFEGVLHIHAAPPFIGLIVLGPALTEFSQTVTLTSQQ